LGDRFVRKKNVNRGGQTETTEDLRRGSYTSNIEQNSKYISRGIKLGPRRREKIVSMVGARTKTSPEETGAGEPRANED